MRLTDLWVSWGETIWGGMTYSICGEQPRSFECPYMSSTLHDINSMNVIRIDYSPTDHASHHLGEDVAYNDGMDHMIKNVLKLGGRTIRTRYLLPRKTAESSQGQCDLRTK